MRVTRLLAVLPLLVLPSSGFFSTNYQGKDAGYPVTSLGAQSGTVYNGCSLFFRKRDRFYSGRVFWGEANMREDRRADFEDGTKTGIVDVTRLPAGDYEIFNFQIFYPDPLQHRHRAERVQLQAGLLDTVHGQARRRNLYRRVHRGRNQGAELFWDAGSGWGVFRRVEPCRSGHRDCQEEGAGVRDVRSAVGNLRSIGNPLIKAGAR